MSIINKIFRTYSEKEIKKVDKIVQQVLALESKIEKLSDNQLKEKTYEFKERFKNGEDLTAILPEAFAVVREASWRVLGMKHFPTQILGGIILHQGRIAEMKTGEGKTLVATLPTYLNAITGLGVHVITVNDYLASRDKEWMGKVYEFLGLTVGCVIHGMNNQEKKEAYAADITYGTNNEFGFDYLRDNMAIYKEDMVQRKLYYAIVDEVDSILIDEARTPLIISGTGDKSTDLYKLANTFASLLTYRKLENEETKSDPFNREYKEESVDFLLDEKLKAISLTDKGTAMAEKFFGIKNLADIENMEIAHHINQAIKARVNMKKDIDYIIQEGEIIIVDEFTGRLMHGRRYSNGLHQAIEAKEGLDVKSESKTLATITFQNYFRMYDKLAGMTGTAKTEEDEFREIYNMDVIEIPTNRPLARIDYPDTVYQTQEYKFKAIIEDIKERHKKRQPILVGTITIETSELISKMLKKEGIKHHVLNAKHHMKEAEIISQAGVSNAVTIATNMAGRGTDIVLGGNPEQMAKNEMKKKGFTDEVLNSIDGSTYTEDEDLLKAREIYKELIEKHERTTRDDRRQVLQAGGLHIIGTERHESRRIDNQLRGRAGRQGDSGSSKFYVSLEDNLIRLFAGERVAGIVEKLNMPQDQALEHSMLTKTIENAQRRVEGDNFSVRKHVLQYDDVMNKQRETIYRERRKVLEGEDLKSHIEGMISNLVSENVEIYTMGEKYPEQWDFEGLEKYLVVQFGLKPGIFESIIVEFLTKEKLIEVILKETKKKYKLQEEEFRKEQFREVERVILLRMVDQKWMDHIDAMDQLRQGMSLRAVGQQDPVRAYQVEGFDMFEEMTNFIQEDTIKTLYNIKKEAKVERQKTAVITNTKSSDNQNSNTVVRKQKKIGRNEPCPCGSGKKYKKCCGDVVAQQSA